VATYGFNEGDAKRIGRAVRHVEKYPEKISLGSPGAKGAVGVRLMLGKAGTATWSKGTSKTVTIYTGDPGSEGTAGTVEAHNYFANINASTSTAYQRWIGLSNNGWGWIVIAAECA
jgi:hypothetical protein